MSENNSDEGVLEILEEPMFVLRTRSAIRQLIIVLCVIAVEKRQTIDDMYIAFERLGSNPEWAIEFLYKTDALLRNRWMSKREHVAEIIVKEMEEMLEILRRDDKETLQSYERIRSEYSDYYGENSAWN